MKETVYIKWSQITKIISLAITIGGIVFWAGTVYNKVNYIATNIEIIKDTGIQNKTDIALLKMFVGFAESK